MPRLRLICRETPSAPPQPSPPPPPPPPAPSPLPPPPIPRPARVTEPAKATQGVTSPPKGNTLPPYKRLTIEDLLATPPPPPPPPPPAVATQARFQTPADIDMTADSAAFDMLACVCDLVCSDPRCEEEAVRQWQGKPEWKRRGAPRGCSVETVDDVEMMEESIIRDFVQAAEEERPTKRQRVDEEWDENWEEPPGSTFSFANPKPERKPKATKAPKAEPQGCGRARPSRLRENPKPSRLVVEQGC